MGEDMCIRILAGMCIDTCADMFVGMSIDTCANMFVGMRIDTCANIFVGMRIDTCAGLHQSEAPSVNCKISATTCVFMACIVMAYIFMPTYLWPI